VKRRAELLPWIIAFKAFKAIVLTALGIALCVTRRMDPLDLLVRVALAVHLPVTSALFAHAYSLVTRVSVSDQTALALTAFAYAGLMGAEGLALYFRHPWARWFTIVATSSLIPLEAYEVVRDPRPLRVLILLANVAVVGYLWKRKEIFDSQSRH
jgi:uncharacterized membrane protein (DUF2068 family)